MLPASILVPRLYLFLPIAATGAALLHARATKHANALRELLVTAIMGAVGGLILVTIYMRSFSGDMPFTQVAAACYWGVSIACAVRGFNLLLAWGFRRILPVGANGQPCCPGSEVAASIFRAIVLLCVGVPYIVGMMVVYHPHTRHAGTPTTVLGSNYENVRFAATDGLRLRGWWIPAAAPGADDESPIAEWGHRTVILCHGFNGDKASDLRLVRDLAPNGFNILAFDFRAHGQSDGQLTTYGDLERRDVLGAVRWLQQNHPNESRKIFGLGQGLGAAALIAAAGDPDEGQAISAIAVFSPYDSLPGLIREIADDHFIPSAGWLTTRFALPIAGAQLGTPLARFSPGGEVDKLAPRPLLVIAAENDDAVDFSLSQAFYEQASQPKRRYWIKRGNHQAMLFKNAKASMSVRVFFETAQNVL